MKKEIYLIFITMILGIYFLGSVFAVEGCCLRTEDGRYNKFVDELECVSVDVGYFQEGVSCEDATFVDENGNVLNEKGCCIDYNNYECSEEIYRAACDDSGLSFESSSTETCSAITLNPNPCTEGCCVVNGIGYYETSVACDARSDLLGEPEFLDLSYSECVQLAYANETGACIKSRTCIHTTQEACLGTFEIGRYCSDDYIRENYGISCIAESYKGCSENPEDIDVYWYDRCRNMEGVAEECSRGDTKCGLENGEYVCASVSCNYNGETLLNRESKCIYDSPVGEGNDFVGSVHGTVTCYEGKLYYENCGNDNGKGRDYICKEILTIDTGFTRAVCVPNLVENCLVVNFKYFEKINDGELEYEEGIKELAEACSEMGQCMFKNRSIDDYFKYNFCVPKDSGTIEIDDETTSCDIATQTCTVYFQKNNWNRFECVENCECLKTESFEEINELCQSFGDCGLNINIVGEIGEERLSFEPEWDKSVSRRFAESTINNYDAIVNRRYLNIAKIVIPNAEENIIKFLRKKYESFNSKTQEPLEIEFPQELMEEILGGEYNSLTEEERKEKMIEYFLEQGIEIEDIALLEQTGWKEDIFLGYNFFDFVGWSQNAIYDIDLHRFILNPIQGLFGHVVDTIDITYICTEWQAPAGGNDCEFCNEGDLGCTEYKCSSLGQNCVLANKDTTNPLCVSSVDDGISPKVEMIEALDEENYFIDEISSNKVWELYSTNSESDCIPENSEIEFVLETNEIAQCKYSFKSYSTYDDMPANYPTSNDYLYEHEFSLNSGNVLSYIDNEDYNDYILCIGENGTKTGCLEELGIENVDVSLKIRCQDIFGHFSDEVELNYCLEVRPDEEEPRVLSFYPESGTEFEYNPRSFDLRLYLNENAECKYGYDNSINYEDLTYEMTWSGKSVSGWMFNATIDEIYLGNNEIYIKCNDTSGNINENIKYEFTLKRDIPEDEYTEDYALIIDSIYVVNNVGGEECYDRENITTGIGPSLSLKVKTSRGVDSGVATCYLNSRKTILMSETDSDEHSQVYNGLSEGTKEFFVLCDDGVSEVSETISIDLIIDDEPPEMVESIAEGDYLTVVTNENAYCTYGNEDCDFDIDEGKTFYEKNYVTEHNTGWNSALSYYVRCVDEFSNEACIGTSGEENNSDGPIITRITYVGDKVTIQTDRSSTCYYDTEECDFDITDSETNEMRSNSDTKHYFEIRDENRYYIKCEDAYGNVNSECTRINVL